MKIETKYRPNFHEMEYTPLPSSSLHNRLLGSILFFSGVRRFLFACNFIQKKTLTLLSECGFTLKCVRDMTRTYSQMHRTDKYSEHSSIIGSV